MSSFRCIQASRLLLDHQLHGTGALSFEARKIVEDATLEAFERIVDACLSHDVDCLLISGDSIDPEDRSLRGAAALVRGIGRLAEREIAVILQSAHPDDLSNWPAGVRFPANVHLFNRETTSVSIARQGQLLASVEAGGDMCEQPHVACTGWDLKIFDAVGTPSMVRLDDDCGASQGIRAEETGPRGCLLIEFDMHRELRKTLLTTAPVRWERFEIDVAGAMTRDDLLQEMASALERTSRHPCEKVWLIAWVLTGNAKLLETLEERPNREALLADLCELDAVPGVIVHTHSFTVRNTDSQIRTLAAGGGDLCAEFAARLDEHLSTHETALRECLAGSALSGGPWEVRIESLVAELDAGEVAHDARRMTMQWFAAQEELSS